MITNAADIPSAVREAFGTSVTVSSKTAAGGGCINATSVYQLSNGETVFIKQNSSRHKGLFSAEAAGLEALSKPEVIRVPEVFAAHEGPSKQFLMMEYIQSGRKSAGFHETFGRLLAEHHRYKPGDTYGFHMDNHIGSTPQINKQSAEWIPFFAEHRIAYQIKCARDSGLADSRMVKRTDTLISRLDSLLVEPAHPSLLHGDLWGGNYMVDGNSMPVLIDPAVYHGHREADLAMTELFGGFSPSFYSAYNETWPLEEGYDQRKNVYNLYHMLNHLNIFGGSYSGSVMSILSHYT